MSVFLIFFFSDLVCSRNTLLLLLLLSGAQVFKGSVKETDRQWWRKRKRESDEKNVKGEDILRKRKENDRKNCLV